MHVGIKGTTPGVGQREELSLSVEDQGPPTSHKAQVDADNPMSCYILVSLGGPQIGNHR